MTISSSKHVRSLEPVADPVLNVSGQVVLLLQVHLDLPVILAPVDQLS